MAPGQTLLPRLFPIRSLALKLVLAFLFISLVVAALGGIISRLLTEQEFGRLVSERAQNRFVTEAAAYYQLNHSWEGIDLYFRLNQPPEIPFQPRPGDPGASEPSQPFQPPFVFVLVDANGRVIVPSGGYYKGQSLTSEQLSKTVPVEVEGQVVGRVLPTGVLPTLDPREERYLQRTNLALLYAALASTAIALVLGWWLARTLTRPLGELTEAIQRMSAGQLEQRVEINTQDELGQLGEAFNQMSVRLSQAVQQRRQMTADIAHDLRTPLTVIAGYVEALRDRVLQPSAQRFETIHIEVQHLLRLVEDLRTLSLADAGELTLQTGALQAEPLLDRVAAAYAQKATQQGIDLLVQVEPGLPVFHADEERIVEVLGNLMTNALRHTPPGGKITLGAKRAMEWIELRVEDTGEGIPEDALPYLFDRFYRVDPSRTQEDEESGLGLAIARSIVEAHGGRIDVESQLGKGSTFKVLLK
jgi:two-component system, OmpR family, sensor histidine kinase BaeS